MPILLITHVRWASVLALKCAGDTGHAQVKNSMIAYLSWTRNNNVRYAKNTLEGQLRRSGN